MKNLALILTVFGLFGLSSCSQKNDVKSMIQNDATRSEIIKIIAENPEYRTEFRANMQSNMIQGEGMQMMMKDSTMMHSMMNGMMNDGKTMGTMMKMMNEKGMMSKDCMESCTKMMGEKGMNMQGMGNMKTSEATTKADHAEHH